MKGVGKLVVSLRGVNFGFWSHIFVIVARLRFTSKLDSKLVE